MLNSDNGYPGVSKAQLQKLVANYHRSVKKVRKGTDQPADHDDKKDSNSIWFSRASIEELFKVNEADGVRIYFAVHDNTVLQTEYDDMLTVVLVATKNNGKGKEVDQLFDEDEPKQPESSGTTMLRGGNGLNHGTICPPYNCP